MILEKKQTQNQKKKLAINIHMSHNLWLLQKIIVYKNHYISTLNFKSIRLWLNKKQMQPIRIKNKSYDNKNDIRYTKNFKFE